MSKKRCNPLDKVMGVEEAAEKWGYAPGTIKNMCAEGKIQSKKIGKTWVISRCQPNPKEKGKIEMTKTKEMVLVGQEGCGEWFLEEPGFEVEEGWEEIEGTFFGEGLTGWFCDSDSGLYIKVFNGRTCGRWGEEPDDA
ncbi:helix-turn-helix domain-containing protein [Laceyella sacchari]|uniref:helix-turn-helix domain-containing protein n=1 Tax=Laceyella sacchari TaxID=37482 RepID=UPI0013047E47|nr:helix-turn-helix domain-containing protein [Laceyella sacchari]